MPEYDVGVTLQVVIEADSIEEAEDIAIKNIQNCLEPYYIEADADEALKLIGDETDEKP